jgi:hypothetical protein
LPETKKIVGGFNKDTTQKSKSNDGSTPTVYVICHLHSHQPQLSPRLDMHREGEYSWIHSQLTVGWNWSIVQTISSTFQAKWKWIPWFGDHIHKCREYTSFKIFNCCEFVHRFSLLILQKELLEYPTFKVSHFKTSPSNFIY